MFLYEKTNRYLKNDYEFFDALKTKDREIRGNCNLLIKVKFHELEYSSPLRLRILGNQEKSGNPQNLLEWYSSAPSLSAKMNFFKIIF